MLNIQDTTHRTQKNVIKLKGPSKDASVPIGREKKATTVGEGGPGREKGWGGQREEHDQVLGEKKSSEIS